MSDQSEALEKLQQQIKKAHVHAKQQRDQIYGVKFSFEIDGLIQNMETTFGLKTIQDLLTKVNKPGSNYLAFDSADENNILGHSLLLRDVKKFFVKNVKQDDMVYIHVFGKQNIATYYVNKKEVLVNEVITKFNQEYQQDRIDTKTEKYGIGSRLEPGMQINDNILKKPIAEYVQDDEGLIRLLSY